MFSYFFGFADIFYFCLIVCYRVLFTVLFTQPSVKSGGYSSGNRSAVHSIVKPGAQETVIVKTNYLRTIHCLVQPPLSAAKM